uniref:Reverse transcriptase Ty1/copia-type domain-containing protein n=1 Tax=Tanacetum cinerariifolium TaxID=118510 RepID=A0A6L2LI42_TANCI|nr:hypothetical protein [Tanacetum cinerariifolium]
MRLIVNSKPHQASPGFKGFGGKVLEEMYSDLKLGAGDNSVSNQSAPTFDHYFELNEMKAQSQEKDTVISKLKERIKSLSGNKNTNKEKYLAITALKNDLRKLKGKSVVDDTVATHTIAPEMLKVNVEPLAPKLLNNRKAHSNYLRHTQEQDAILRERPTSQTFTIVGNACPLTRITTTTEVPSRKPFSLETDTPKPVVTLVYSRKPRKSKSTNPVSKSKVVQIVLWYLDFGCSKHMTGDRSLLTNFVNKFLGTVKSKNDQVTKITDPIFRNIKWYQILLRSFDQKKNNTQVQQSLHLWPNQAQVLKMRQGLVRGLPKLKFEKDHLCSACVMGKSKNKPHKPKSKDTNQEKLYLLHMDLYGPMRVASVNGKKYILVIVDDYFRFTWVKCLTSKDEALDFIIKFLKMIQVGISRETSVARSPQQNGVIERQNRTLIEPACTILGPVLHEMTPATISSGLMPNTPPSTPFVPLLRSDWDILFQLLFDELLTPPPSVDHPAPKVIFPITEVVALEPAASTGSPSSTTIDQDAPSPISTRLQLHKQALFYYCDAFLTAVKPKMYKDALTHSCWIKAIQEELNEFKRLEVWELVPRPDKVMVITLKWIYKVKLDELGGILKNKTRLVAHGYRQEEGINFEESFLRQPDRFVDIDNPNHVYKLKKALYGLKQAPRECPRGIFINQSKYALESLKKYNFDSCDLVDTPMVDKSKLDKDKEGKTIDPSHYRDMIGTILYLTASRHDLQFAICMCASMQFLGDRLVSWSSKRQKSAAISSTESKYIALSGCCAQVLWMRSQLIDYGLGFNKILMYCDNKSAIALCCKNVQHSRSKHIDIRFHFIKEHVENGVIELYFINTDYQLPNIFTKALGRERIEFLINKKGMRSFTPKTLKQLRDKVEEYCFDQVLWMRSQLIDYGLGFNKISMYCDNKSAIALCCKNVQHSRSKHIDIRFHFIKEHVENGMIELYFINKDYQLADIFTKALGRERIEFLINKQGMRSFTPKTLKQLADEVEETIDITRAEQIALDDALVAPANRLKISKSNLRLSSDLKSKEATFQVQFKEPPFEEVILAFLRDIGHSCEIKVNIDVNVNKLHQPWRSFAAVINKCLSGKSTGYDSLRLSQAQKLWGIYHKKNPSGNPTFSSNPELTSLEVNDDIFDLEGGNVLPVKLLDLDSTKDLYPPLHVNQLSGCTTYSSSLLLEELFNELALITFPLKYDDDLQFDVKSDLKDIEFLLHQDIDSNLKDSIDQKVESDTENVYDDPFDSKGEKIKESKLLIDELDLLVIFFLPNKKLAISNASLVLEDFDPPLYEPVFFKEVPMSNMLLSFSSENEEKVFKPGIHTSEKVHSSFISELSHQGYKIFKINQIFKSPMKIFLFSCRKDTDFLVVPCLYFYPP